MSDNPQPTPDCCDIWPTILWHFQWMEFTDWQGIVTMPYLEAKDGTRIRINFCPSCGKDVRACVVEHMRVWVV